MPDSAQVVVIGGGCVGAGVLWDLTLRGVEALLIEQGDLANGATGRCHGLLHSGGRYAVTDPDSAKECIQENYIIRRIAAHCVEDTGGFFVELDQDDPTYTDLWVKSCQEVGIPAEEVSKEEFLATEPLASPRVRRAFRVPDASIDPFRLVQSHVQSAEKLGGRWLTYTRVTGFLMKNSRVAGVEVQDTRTGEKKHIYCDLIVNAAGAWADQIGSLAGIHIPIVPNKGTLLVFHHRFVNHCLNRLRPPSDGDVFVPVGSVVLLGTTSINVPAPEGYTIEPEEVQKILAIGSEMIPYLKSARIQRAFAGVRPLYEPRAQEKEGAERQISRNFYVLDHETADNIKGLVSIVGGKLTSYRLMAEQTANLVCAKLGISAPCRTREVPLPEAVFSPARDRLSPLQQKTEERQGGGAREIEKLWAQSNSRHIVCECELVTRAELEHVVSRGKPLDLGDLRRRTRLGLGTCQGAFCSYRAAALLHSQLILPVKEANKLLRDFLEERWKGNRYVLWGKQLQELQLARAIYGHTLNLGQTDDEP